MTKFNLILISFLVSVQFAIAGTGDSPGRNTSITNEFKELKEILHKRILLDQFKGTKAAPKASIDFLNPKLPLQNIPTTIDEAESRYLVVLSREITELSKIRTQKGLEICRGLEATKLQCEAAVLRSRVEKKAIDLAQELAEDSAQVPDDIYRLQPLCEILNSKQSSYKSSWTSEVTGKARDLRYLRAIYRFVGGDRHYLSGLIHEKLSMNDQLKIENILKCDYYGSPSTSRLKFRQLNFRDTLLLFDDVLFW